jgi:hypothetical protein
MNFVVLIEVEKEAKIKDLDKIINILNKKNNIKGDIYCQIDNKHIIKCYIYPEQKYKISDIEKMLNNYNTKVEEIKIIKTKRGEINDDDNEE